MCDIWKANQNKQEISPGELKKHVEYFKRLGVREVVLSGGEPLMHSNLWALCRILTGAQIRITLLTTGLLLEKNAPDIVHNIDRVIISIDGSEQVHDRIRNVPNGFRKIASGIMALREIDSRVRITARCVLQRLNFRDLEAIVQASKSIGIGQISFLAADVSTHAFNHSEKTSVTAIALTIEETIEFHKIVEDSFITLKDDYSSGFIAERPEAMRRIVKYYKAINGTEPFPRPHCNAPWVSAVIESNGDVMPCFFHKPYGNIFDADFLNVINSEKAILFRRDLNISNDEICQKCVCSLKLGYSPML